MERTLDMNEQIGRTLRYLLIGAAISLFFVLSVHAEPASLFGTPEARQTQQAQSLSLADDESLQTLFGANSDIEMGGFGGPMVLYTSAFGTDGTLVGGMGAVSFNDKFYIGAGGYGFANEVEGSYTDVFGETSRMEFGYGGMILGATLASDAVLHLVADVMIGGGAVVQSMGYEDYGYQNDNRGYHFNEDRFFATQPQLHAELNLTSWMRMRGTVGYRWTNGVSKSGYSDEDMSGLVAGGGLVFGSF